MPRQLRSIKMNRMDNLLSIKVVHDIYDIVAHHTRQNKFKIFSVFFPFFLDLLPQIIIHTSVQIIHKQGEYDFTKTTWLTSFQRVCAAVKNILVTCPIERNVATLHVENRPEPFLL